MKSSSLMEWLKSPELFIVRQEDDLFKEKNPQDLVTYDIKFTGDNSFTLDDKPVAELRIGYSLEQDYISFGYFIFTDGSKAIKSIATEKSTLLFLLEDFHQQRFLRRSNVFKNRNTTVINWRANTQTVLYRENVKEEYAHIHDHLITNLFALLGRLSIAKGLLIDFGCGDGTFEVSLATRKTEEKLLGDLAVIGIDLEQNIGICREKQAELKKTFTSCHFHAGDLREVSEYLPGLITGSKEKEAKVLLISSGSLTRGIFKNAMEVIKILQQLVFLDIDFFMGDGFDEPFINADLVAQLGFEPDHHAYYRNSFLFRRIPEEKFLTRLQNQIDRNQILNVSPHPQPELLLKKLKLADKLTIDLSFCPLSTELVSFLKKNPHLTLIYWHSDLDEIDKFLNAFVWIDKPYPSSLKLVTDDIDLMAPKDFLLTLNTKKQSIINLSQLLAGEEAKVSVAQLTKKLIQSGIKNGKTIGKGLIEKHLSILTDEKGEKEEKYSSRKSSLALVKSHFLKFSEDELNAFLKLDTLIIKIVNVPDQELKTYDKRIRALAAECYDKITETSKISDIYLNLNLENQNYDDINTLYSEIKKLAPQPGTALASLKIQIEVNLLTDSFAKLYANFHSAYNAILRLQLCQNDLRNIPEYPLWENRQTLIKNLRNEFAFLTKKTDFDADFYSRSDRLADSLDILYKLDGLYNRFDQESPSSEINALKAELLVIYSQIETNTRQAQKDYTVVNEAYEKILNQLCNIPMLNFLDDDDQNDSLIGSPKTSPDSASVEIPSRSPATVADKKAIFSFSNSSMGSAGSPTNFSSSFSSSSSSSSSSSPKEDFSYTEQLHGPQLFRRQEPLMSSSRSSYASTTAGEIKNLTNESTLLSTDINTLVARIESNEEKEDKSVLQLQLNETLTALTTLQEKIAAKRANLQVALGGLSTFSHPS